MDKLHVGDEAPNFQLPDQDGNLVALSDYRGRRLLVYFYPKADTPGCTAQSCSVRDAMPGFGELGIQAVGISPDAPEALKKFDEKFSLGFPLLSDPQHEAALKWGAWGEKFAFGKRSEGMIRSSFLLNEKAVLLGAWYNVKPQNTVPKALAALERSR